ncbi:MAG: HDOD domain-containing protein [Planctomycetota bacterium]|nr:HDOD domain-containing protein [Planctomycetota bacterium]MCZ6817260.1 HDOD domain-containing protein [Planctomycetota bacterium]
MLAEKTSNCDEAIVNAAIADVGEIATLPEVTLKIIKIVENPKSTARDLHEVIKNDPALATRILKVVNSAFYGLPGQIASVDRAIVLLGLSAVKNIAIAASMTRLFQCGEQIEGFSAVDLWRHSITVAVACRQITTAQGRSNVDESFLAGLIHDLGILVERQVFPRKLAEIIAKQKSDGGDFTELEREVIGADHQAFGMALATKWRFPRLLCAAIGYHHNLDALAPENRELATLVHVADIIACKAKIGFSTTAENCEVQADQLELLNLSSEKLEVIQEELAEQVSDAENLFRE